MQQGIGSNSRAAIQPQSIVHPFAPVFSPASRILILGTMPSRQSRLQGFYYGHPQNRFWPLLARLLKASDPGDPAGRRNLLLQHDIAIWDVLQRCEITGSADSSIRQPQVNDLAWLLRQCPIRQIFTNGLSATLFYRTRIEPSTGRPCTGLPSTSPANGRYSLDLLVQAWQPVLVALRPEQAAI
jgi:double-stranded uracil-DNA glycosylase